MTNLPKGDPIVELGHALAGAEAADPPANRLELVKASAFGERRPGRPLVEPPAISSDVVFTRAVDSLDALLGTLAEAAWHRPALRDLDVQGLVGHLIGVENSFREAIGPQGLPASFDHVRSTQIVALAQRGRSPASTYRDWQASVRKSIELLAGAEMSQAVSLHRLEMALDRQLVIRAFELWTHEEDIRRALGMALIPPDPSSLQSMIDVAVELLPEALSSLFPGGGSSSARLVLVGSAGGAFDVPFAPGGRAEPGTRIVADALQFCRLAADRAPSSETVLSVSGERALADGLFAGARSLALD